MGRPRRRWLRRGVLVLVTVLLVEYVVLPQLVGAREAVDLLLEADPVVLLAALALEIGGLLAYSALTRSVLRPTGRPPYDVLLRIDLTGYGASHVIPGGGATAAALRYRLLTHAGVDRRDAVTGTAIQTAVGIGGLVLVFVAGLGAVVSRGEDLALFGTAGAVALGFVAGTALVLVALLHDPVMVRVGAAAVLARLPRAGGAAPAVDRVLVGLSSQVRVLLQDRRRLGWVCLFAVGNWLLDAAALWTCLHAFGHTPDIGLLLAVYGLVNLVALLPVTPGGLGIVEGILVPALITFGAAPAAALLGVLTWRLVQFWLPIPVAGVTYLSLRWGTFHDRDAETDHEAPPEPAAPRR